MNKMKMMLAVLFAGLLGLTVLATPSSADVGTWETKQCTTFDGTTKTCLEVGWSKQADGTGVRLERMTVSTPEGCSHLDDPEYRNVTADWYSVEGPDYNYDFGSEDCNWTKDVSNAGRDQHGMTLGMDMRAVPWSPFWNDTCLQFYVTVQPDGDASWITSSHYTC